MDINLKEVIAQNIRLAKSNGWKLVRGRWVDHDYKCACALGCVLLNRNDTNHVLGETMTAKAARHLGVSLDWIIGFYRGFDNAEYPGRYNGEAFQIGQEISQEFKPE